MCRASPRKHPWLARRDFINYGSPAFQEQGAEIVQGCQSGQMDLTVNQAGFALRRFESYPLQLFLKICARRQERRGIGQRRTRAMPPFGLFVT